MAGMLDHGAGASRADHRAFKAQLNKVYGWYTGGFLAFIIVLAILEQLGLPKNWIGFIFLLATVGLYAGIGIMSRTTDAAEYYVAGRRVPAIYNGMATGADWMNARPRTCASSGSSRFLTFSGRATRGTCRASSASWRRSCAHSRTWWHRSTASG